MINQALSSAIRRGQVVAYIGAGFSMTCGMPDWSNLILQIYNDANQLACSDQDRQNLLNCKNLISKKNST